MRHSFKQCGKCGRRRVLMSRFSVLQGRWIHEWRQPEGAWDSRRIPFVKRYLARAMARAGVTDRTLARRLDIRKAIGDRSEEPVRLLPREMRLNMFPSSG